MCDQNCKSGCHCSGTNGIVMAVGRVLLASLFLVTGWGMLMNFSGTVGFIGSIVGASLATVATIVVLIFKLGGAVMLLTGFHARVASYMLIAFTVAATFIGHNIFAAQSDPQTAYTNFIMFWKNISIIGGLLYVSVFGAGSYSLKQYDKKICMAQAACPDCKAN